jgi:hypothetical protein
MRSWLRFSDRSTSGEPTTPRSEGSSLVTDSFGPDHPQTVFATQVQHIVRLCLWFFLASMVLQSIGTATNGFNYNRNAWPRFILVGVGVTLLASSVCISMWVRRLYVRCRDSDAAPPSVELDNVAGLNRGMSLRTALLTSMSEDVESSGSGNGSGNGDFGNDSGGSGTPSEVDGEQSPSASPRSTDDADDIRSVSQGTYPESTATATALRWKTIVSEAELLVDRTVFLSGFAVSAPDRYRSSVRWQAVTFVVLVGIACCLLLMCTTVMTVVAVTLSNLGA